MDLGNEGVCYMHTMLSRECNNDYNLHLNFRKKKTYVLVARKQTLSFSFGKSHSLNHLQPQKVFKQTFFGLKLFAKTQ